MVQAVQAVQATAAWLGKGAQPRAGGPGVRTFTIQT